jgi:membrane-associated phospholipid phosphatase
VLNSRSEHHPPHRLAIFLQPVTEYLHMGSYRSQQAAEIRPILHGIVVTLALVLALAVSQFLNAQVQQQGSDKTADTPAPNSDSAPSSPPSSQNQTGSFSSSIGVAIRTIAKDELHIIKAPFSLEASTLKWDALAVGATGVLIAKDESVLHEVPATWHSTSLNISNAAIGGLGATAGGIFLTGLITHDEHATETGIRSAEAAIDSLILYSVLKPVLGRQRPYTGAGEGKFFSGNWTSGSFPSGHSTLAWTLATVMAREYPNWPMRLLMYGAATAVSTTRVTGGVHFPADVFSGAVIGFGVGTFVSHKDSQHLISPRSQNRLTRIENAFLARVAIQ